MKKHLIPANVKQQKANLHCHSTLSDGRLTPCEIKEEYKKRGYSVVAFTDHELFFTHNDLTDSEFLAVNGYEIAPNSCGRKCYHVNLIATSDKIDRMVHPIARKIKDWNIRAGRPEDFLPHPIEKFSEPIEYSPEALNAVVKEASDGGFIAVLNHPAWSLQDFSDYEDLEGFHAIELCNYSCLVSGFLEDSNHIYDRLLRAGKYLVPFATDDNHNSSPLDSEYNDSFGGITYILSDKLDYDSVIAAIKKGDVYSSNGPTFEEVYFEDGKVYIKCSPCHSIRLLNEGRDAPVVIAEWGKPVTEAVFEVDPYFCGKYARVDIRDESGRFADTRAFKMEELFGENA